MKDNELIHSGLSALGSLIGYYKAKEKGKHEIPAMLVGGFVGTLISVIITTSKLK